MMGNAKYVGRVGALAVALGIGTAVAATPGVAVAEPSAESSSASDSSSNASSSAESSSTDGSKPATSVDSSGADPSSESDEDGAPATPGVAADEGSAPSTDGDTSSTPDTPETSEPTAREPEDAEPAADPVVSEDPPPAPEPVVEAEKPDNGGLAAVPPVTVDRPHAALTASATAMQEDTPEPVALTTRTDTPIELAPTPQAAAVSSTVQATVVEAQAVLAPPAQPAAPTPAMGVVSNLLAWVGLSPGVTNAPVAPVGSPALWAVLAWARRESQQSLSTVSPSATYISALNGQTVEGVGTVDEIDAAAVGLPGATPASLSAPATQPNIVSALLHLLGLYNQAPTTNYDPTENHQIPGGVVTGELHAVDPDWDALSFTVTQAPAHGTVVINADGTFTYTPEAGFAQTGGTDAFTVTVSDNYGSLLLGPATVSTSVAVTVEPINTVIATIDVGDNPGDVAVSPDGTRAYVTNHNDDTVSVIDTNTNTVTATITVGDAPNGLAVSADGTRAYVAHGDFVGTVSVIDTGTNTVVDTITIGDGPNGLNSVAVSPDGVFAYITNFDDDTVSVINTATNTVTATITVGDNPRQVAVSPDGTRAYVTNHNDGTVSVIDTITNTVTATITVGNDPIGVAVSPDGATVYVTRGDNPVVVIDTATNTVTTDVFVGNFPERVAVSPDGATVYVPQSCGLCDKVSVIDTATNTVITTITVGVDPTGVAVRPDGTRAYVVNTADGTVSVIRL